MKDPLDNEIQKALQPASADREPSTDLLRKLRTLAHDSAPRPLWRRTGFSVPVSMAAVVATAVVATTLLPAKASAKSFGLIVAAAQRIDAFQFSIVSNEDAQRETFTVAGSEGHVVLRTGESTVMEIDAGSMSFYDPEDKKVMRFKYGNLAEAANVAKAMQSGLAKGLKEIDLKKMLKEYAEKYGQDGIRISPVSREDGRSVYHVTLASPSQPERVEMTVDASSDLPELLQVQTRDGGQGWRDSVTMEMRFGERVDPRLLRSSIPKDAPIETIDLSGMVDGALKGLKSLGDEFGSGSSKKP